MFSSRPNFKLNNRPDSSFNVSVYENNELMDSTVKIENKICATAGTGMVLSGMDASDHSVSISDSKQWIKFFPVKTNEKEKLQPKFSL